MHRNNSKYGHDVLLSDYVGVSRQTPILGEIQHSLFLSRFHFDSHGRIGPPRKTGAFPFPFFSWQNLIPFKNQVPIGDPLIYCLASEKDRPQHPSPKYSTSRYPLVMPKLNEERAPHERESNYRRLVAFAREYSGADRVNLLLHPKEYRSGISDNLKSIAGTELVMHLQNTPFEATRHSLALLENSSAVYSDYLGTHLFRAKAFFSLPTYISAFSPETKWPYEPRIRDLLEYFGSNALPLVEEISIARELLGFSHRKEPEELRQLLFRPDLPSNFRALLVASYKTSRRAKVSFRQSKLFGRHPLFRAIRRRFIRPLWVARQNFLEKTG